MMSPAPRSGIEPDFTPIYAKLRESPAHAAGDVLDEDRVFTRGDRVGWATNADT